MLLELVLQEKKVITGKFASTGAEAPSGKVATEVDDSFEHSRPHQRIDQAYSHPMCAVRSTTTQRRERHKSQHGIVNHTLTVGS